MVRIISNKRRPADRRQKLRVGDVFSAQVLDIGSDGRAVVQHPSGLRVFVAGAWLNEQVKVRISELKQQYGSAELLEIITKAPERIDPPCGHHGVGQHSCGGCGWMFVDYPAQLTAKQLRVEKALTGLAADGAIAAIWGSVKVLGYRSRAQLKTDGNVLGFVQPASRNLAAINDCIVLSEPNRNSLKLLKERLPEPAWRPQASRSWTTLDIDEQTGADAVSVNQRLPFHQANVAQNQRMRQWLAGHTQSLPRQYPVLELFAGSGNFTRVISELNFAQITAVEVVAEALAGLREAELPGVILEACDLFNEDAVQRLLTANAQTKILVLDPPRDGLKARGPFTKGLPKLEKVFYISCDLATFRRDAQLWLDRGMVLTEVQPVDLFPQTPHVELLAVFERK